MKYKILIASFLAFFSLIACGFGEEAKSFHHYQHMYPELAKFYGKYRCSDNVEKVIKYKQPQHIKNDVVKCGNYYVKANFERIVNAKRLENYIKSKELKHIYVAKKYLNKDLLVVAKQVPSCSLEEEKMVEETTQVVYQKVIEPAFCMDEIVKRLPEDLQKKTPEELTNTKGIRDILSTTSALDIVSYVACNPLEADLCDFTRDTYYADVHAGNFVFDGKAKKLVVIDTETRSFQALANRIEYLKIKKYDDSDIDVEKVLKEHRKFAEHRIFNRYLDRMSSSLFL